MDMPDDDDATPKHFIRSWSLELKDILWLLSTLAIGAVFLVTTFAGYQAANADQDRRIMLVTSDLDLTKQRLSQVERAIDQIGAQRREDMSEIKSSLKELGGAVASVHDTVLGMRAGSAK